MKIDDIKRGKRLYQATTGAIIEWTYLSPIQNEDNSIHWGFLFYDHAREKFELVPNVVVNEFVKDMCLEKELAELKRITILEELVDKFKQANKDNLKKQV